MPGITILCFLCFVIFNQQNSYAVDTLAVAESMRDGDTISSAGGVFELGFFSPGNSTNRYVGIWYKNIPVFTVVWVANRQVPLANRSGVLKLVRNPASTLILLDGIETNNTMWSSSSDMSKGVTFNPILQLLDSGNLVVRDGNDHNPENFRWQSFDYPGDTLLPGMKCGRNFKTGLETYLSSWTSADDPSPGNYTYHFDPTGYPQVIIRNNSVDYFRLGSWNGLGFSGFRLGYKNGLGFSWFSPGSAINGTYITRVIIDYNMEVYFTFDLVNNLSFSKITMTPDGILKRLSWVGERPAWTALFSLPADTCDTYSLCGAYGSCNILCRCLDKFVPKNQREWDLNDGSSGCVRMKSLDCKTDGFRKYSGLKLPDTRSSWSNSSMKLDECEKMCLNNCSCMAYATLDLKEESGCLLWFGELIDMKDISPSFQDIYVRMASSDSDHTELKSFGSNEKKEVVVKVAVPLVLGAVLLALSLVVYCWRKNKRSQLKRQGRQGNINETQKEDMELQFFALPMITSATRNFSISNKLGEGGFGPVYKGILVQGQEIAVKRLSKTSTQGFEEFKNEVVCIAKLQHRNLVKLLGCCIQGDEKLLIYEYMPNGSLDTFIFDNTQCTILDWTKRFNIIKGIARGLLYLHQDSRLRIIHRDLKASNILLDPDMNPKISDFGIARSFGGNETEANTDRVVGTYGYMSPEYAVDGIFSTKSDVFSFGVLILEIISGKRNRGFIHPKHQNNLIGHAWQFHNEGRSMELIDPSLAESCHPSEVLRSIEVGLLCVQQSAEDRPNMSYVVRMLDSEGALPQPKQPAFFMEGNLLEADFSSSTYPVSSNNDSTMTELVAR